MVSSEVLLRRIALYFSGCAGNVVADKFNSSHGYSIAYKVTNFFGHPALVILSTLTKIEIQEYSTPTRRTSLDQSEWKGAFHVKFLSNKKSDHLNKPAKISWPQKLTDVPVESDLGWPITKVSNRIHLAHEYPWPKLPNQDSSCVQVCGESKKCTIQCTRFHKSSENFDDSAIQWPQERVHIKEPGLVTVPVPWPQQPQGSLVVPWVTRNLIGGDARSPGPGAPTDIILIFAVGGLAIPTITTAKLAAFRYSLETCTTNNVRDLFDSLRSKSTFVQTQQPACMCLKCSPILKHCYPITYDSKLH